MVTTTESAVKRFIAQLRDLHEQEPDVDRRWDRMIPVMRELLADPGLRESSKEWPDTPYTKPGREPALLRGPGLWLRPQRVHQDQQHRADGEASHPRPRPELDSLRCG